MHTTTRVYTPRAQPQRGVPKWESLTHYYVIVCKFSTCVHSTVPRLVPVYRDYEPRPAGETRRDRSIAHVSTAHRRIRRSDAGPLSPVADALSRMANMPGSAHRLLTHESEVQDHIFRYKIHWNMRTMLRAACGNASLPCVRDSPLELRWFVANAQRQAE
jgi:hypothetical protein